MKIATVNLSKVHLVNHGNKIFYTFDETIISFIRFSFQLLEYFADFSDLSLKLLKQKRFFMLR